MLGVQASIVKPCIEADCDAPQGVVQAPMVVCDGAVHGIMRGDEEARVHELKGEEHANGMQAAGCGDKGLRAQVCGKERVEEEGCPCQDDGAGNSDTLEVAGGWPVPLGNRGTAGVCDHRLDWQRVQLLQEAREVGIMS